MMPAMGLKETLKERGVCVVDAGTVHVAEDVRPERLAPGVVIHPGCRLSGSDLLLGPGCVIGEEGPVTLTNCQLGCRVEVKSGFLDQATLLDGVTIGSNAHVRPGTLLEEEVTTGHAVGLKQTILMPYVTLGSLINFCDVLMAGGTGVDDHGEVGSSFVHFNFTPHQDKATASLIGDVASGVLLDQPAIFLGGQGGIVGPCRIAYGCVLAAGQICRRDALVPGQLIVPAAPAPGQRPYDRQQFPGISRIALNNMLFVGNLLALDQWYRHVRRPCMAAGLWQQALVEGGLQRLAEALSERLKRLEGLAAKAVQGLASLGAEAAPEPHRRFVAEWPALRARLQAALTGRERMPAPDAVAALGQRMARNPGGYRAAVKALSQQEKGLVSAWLQGLVDGLAGDGGSSVAGRGCGTGRSSC